MKFACAIFAALLCGCAHKQAPKVPVVQEKPCLPVNECPECPTCDKVEVGNCYHMLGFSVFFPVYNDDGSIKEVIPVPSIEPGCYCRIMVNDFPTITSFPVQDSFCEGEDDGSELDGQGSDGETPPEGAGSVGRVPEVEPPHSN